MKFFKLIGQGILELLLVIVKAICVDLKFVLAYRIRQACEKVYGESNTKSQKVVVFNNFYYKIIGDYKSYLVLQRLDESPPIDVSNQASEVKEINKSTN